MTSGRTPGARRDVDRGQLLPILAIVLLVGALGALGLARLAVASNQRARAQDAADAVALAGAGGGRAAADLIAGADHATILAYQATTSGVVEVTVRLGPAVARARAGPDNSEDALGTGRTRAIHPVHFIRVQRP